MKKILFLITVLTLTAYNELIAEEIQTSAKIKKATIYWQSASIEANVNRYVNKGEHILIIDQMPSNIDLNSIQVSSENEFTIVSVESQIASLESLKKSKTFLALKDSLEYYEDLHESIKIKKFAVDEELSLWLSNKNIGSKASSVVELEDMAEVYKNRLPQLKRESYMYEKSMIKLKEKISYFQNLINEKNASNNSVELIVRIMNPQSQNIDLNIKYLCYDAGWSPFYDIRSEDKSDEITFYLKANVWQNTGIDFNGIELTLSTGIPNTAGVKPELMDWRLSLAENRPRLVPESNTIYDMSTVELKSSAVAGASNKLANGMSSYVQTSENMNKIEYQIAKAFDITSGSGRKIVEIQKNSTKANYRYVSIPKLDTKAYLIASILDWEKLMLTHAEANVFIDGAYISKTIINPASIEDSLEFSLGEDESIKVERKLINDQNSTKSIGSTKKISQKYEINVRNTKSKAIKIDILDQLPLSGDKNIEIQHSAPEASYDAITGRLTWTYTIKPAENKKMSYQFEIKYPKKMILVGW